MSGVERSAERTTAKNTQVEMPITICNLNYLLTDHHTKSVKTSLLCSIDNAQPMIEAKQEQLNHKKIKNPTWPYHIILYSLQLNRLS